MAKVISPYDTFKITKRIGERVLLKDRKEGLVVGHQALTRKMVFFKQKHDNIIKEKLKQRWNALTQQQQQQWEQLGITVGMDGETFYKQEQKKSMTKGFYATSIYGATKYFGVIYTKYATLYGEAIYGVNKYRFK